MGTKSAPRAAKHVLFVHGAGEGAYGADAPLAASLRDALGAENIVRYPMMPDAGSPSSGAWKASIAHEIATMSGEVMLVGHSLGASVLLQYLAEVPPPRPIAGLFLVACPYWSADDWQVAEFALPADVATRLLHTQPIVFYFSRDDEVVPFAHRALYERILPQATFRTVDGRDHQFNNDLSDVARDICIIGQDG